MLAQMVHDKENAGNATAAPTEIMPQKASAADTVPATNAHAGGAAPYITDSACVVVITVVLKCVCVGLDMGVGVHTNACTHVRIRTRTLSRTHANAQVAPHEHQNAVFASDLQCVYLYYTPTHISTIPCCACSLHHRRTNTRTHAHTRAHMHRAREKKR
jgi:hypothetical protein